MTTVKCESCPATQEVPEGLAARGLSAACKACHRRTRWTRLVPAAAGAGAGAAVAVAAAAAGPNHADHRFYIKQGYCGFIFNWNRSPVRYLATSGLATCVGFTLYDVQLHSGALGHFDSDNNANAGEVATQMVTVLQLQRSRLADLRAHIAWCCRDRSTITIRNGIAAAMQQLRIPVTGGGDGDMRAGGDDVVLDLADGSLTGYRERDLAGSATNVPLMLDPTVLIGADNLAEYVRRSSMPVNASLYRLTAPLTLAGAFLPPRPAPRPRAPRGNGA